MQKLAWIVGALSAAACSGGSDDGSADDEGGGGGSRNACQQALDNIAEAQSACGSSTSISYSTTTAQQLQDCSADAEAALACWDDCYVGFSCDTTSQDEVYACLSDCPYYEFGS